MLNDSLGCNRKTSSPMTDSDLVSNLKLKVQIIFRKFEGFFCENKVFQSHANSEEEPLTEKYFWENFLKIRILENSMLASLAITLADNESFLIILINIFTNLKDKSILTKSLLSFCAVVR